MLRSSAVRRPPERCPRIDDLYNAITRGFVDTNMPSWRPLTPQQRADLVAFIKTWSPRWAKEKPGAVLNIPARDADHDRKHLARPGTLPEA